MAVDLNVVNKFNSRAERVAQSRVLEWIHKRPKNINHRDLAHKDWIETMGMDREDLDAFCLNLRLLVQDRDGISLRCLHQLYDALPPKYNDFKKLAASERKDLNDYLEASSLIQLGNDINTNRQLFETFFYGGLVHEDSKYENQFRTLTTSGVFTILTVFSFWNIVMKLSDSINRMALLNGYLLEELASGT